MTNNRRQKKSKQLCDMEKKPSPSWIHLTSAKAERCCVAVVQSCILYGSSHILYSTVFSKPHKKHLSFSSKSHRHTLFRHFVWPAAPHSRQSSSPVTAVSLNSLQVQLCLRAGSNQTGSPLERGQEVIPPFCLFWEVSMYMNRDQYELN